MLSINRYAAVPALLATAALVSAPAHAAAIPTPIGKSMLAAELAWQPAGAVAADYRPWRHRYRHRDRDRIDAGDILAGVLVLGGIAAIATAATRKTQRAPYPPPPPYPDYRAEYATAAVRACIDAVERDTRVEGGLQADETRFGYTVRGRLSGGGRFACEVGRDGRVSGIDYAGRYASPRPYRGQEGTRRDREEDEGYDASTQEAAPDYPDSPAEDANGADNRPVYPGDLPQRGNSSKSGESNRTNSGEII